MKSNLSVSIKRHTVTGLVAEELRQRIVSGRYLGGEQIRQEAIAGELGVSRIPIREALLQLEAEGLVVIRTHRGAIVTDLTPNDAADIFEARLLLEPELVTKATRMATSADISAIEATLDEYEEAVKNGVSPQVLSRLNCAFHVATCRPANRPRMVTMLLSLHTGTDRYLRLQIDRPNAKRKALRDHRSIFEAFRNKKASQAGSLMKAHISAAYEDVMKCIEGVQARKK